MLKYQKDLSGFTLIEVLMVITITGIITISIYNINEAAWGFWNTSQEKLDLKQQARVIMIYLENNLREAAAVLIKDVDNDGHSELLLNLGDSGGSKDDTDAETDFYLQYNVRQKKLTVKKPYNSFNTSGISYPDWPDTEDWSYNRSLTLELIEDYEFRDLQGDGSLIYYKFCLQKGDNTLTFENVVHPRKYNNKGL